MCKLNLLACCTSISISLTAAELPHPQPLGTIKECAAEYGHLMVQHWLNVDTCRQAERLQFYQRAGDRSSGSAQSFETLMDGIGRSELLLEKARELCKAELKDPSAHSALPEIRNLLIQAGRLEGKDAEEVDSLLGALGARIDGFSPEPVSETDIRPAWDGPGTIRQDFKPNRILFGSTGRAGDDRTLALDFDFGSGTLSFVAPMATSNSLALDPALLK
jgi:hypothetical protein